MIVVWFGRLQADKWWKTLLVCMLTIPVVLTLFVGLFLFKVIKSLLLPQTNAVVVGIHEKEKEQQSTTATEPTVADLLSSRSLRDIHDARAHYWSQLTLDSLKILVTKNKSKNSGHKTMQCFSRYKRKLYLGHPV